MSNKPKNVNSKLKKRIEKIKQKNGYIPPLPCIYRRLYIYSHIYHLISSFN